LISERKGTDPHWKHLRCTHFASYRDSRDVIASLASVRLTGWPVAWKWRRAFLSADAGLLVLVTFAVFLLNFYSARNARIGSAVLATAITSVRHMPVLCQNDGT